MHNSGINTKDDEGVISSPNWFGFAASCLSFVPEKGTVGASGDLAPLSHLALGLMGEGKMWSPKSGWADAKYVRAAPNSLQEAAFCSREILFKGSKVERDVFALCPSCDFHVFVCFHPRPGPGSPWT